MNVVLEVEAQGAAVDVQLRSTNGRVAHHVASKTNNCELVVAPVPLDVVVNLEYEGVVGVAPVPNGKYSASEYSWK